MLINCNPPVICIVWRLWGLTLKSFLINIMLGIYITSLSIYIWSILGYSRRIELKIVPKLTTIAADILKKSATSTLLGSCFHFYGPLSWFDFSGLYKTIPHSKLINSLFENIGFCFKGSRQLLAFGKYGASWISNEKQGSITFSKSSLKMSWNSYWITHISNLKTKYS